MNIKTILVWVLVIAGAYFLWTKFGSRIRESI